MRTISYCDNSKGGVLSKVVSGKSDEWFAPLAPMDVCKLFWWMHLFSQMIQKYFLDNIVLQVSFRKLWEAQWASVELSPGSGLSSPSSWVQCKYLLLLQNVGQTISMVFSSDPQRGWDDLLQLPLLRILPPLPPRQMPEAKRKCLKYFSFFTFVFFFVKFLVNFCLENCFAPSTHSRPSRRMPEGKCEYCDISRTFQIANQRVWNRPVLSMFFFC